MVNTGQRKTKSLIFIFFSECCKKNEYEENQSLNYKRTSEMLDYSVNPFK